jgi:uncharacterized membrane protein
MPMAAELKGLKMWVLFACLSAFSAALVAVFAKLGLREVDPTLATTLRSRIMAAFLVLTAGLLGKFSGFSLQVLNSTEWGLLVLAGVAGALSWLASCRATSPLIRSSSRAALAKSLSWPLRRAGASAISSTRDPRRNADGSASQSLLPADLISPALPLSLTLTGRRVCTISSMAAPRRE